MPKVTVFIPVYNTERYIGETIQSIISQTYEDWELIVLDDCSTDTTFDIAKAYEMKDHRIKVYRNEKNLGMMANWNNGIPLCKSEYFGKLDADDRWHPETLFKSVNVLDKMPNVGLVCGRYMEMDEENVLRPETVPDIPEWAKNSAFSCLDLVNEGPRGMFGHNILRQGIALIRRNIFDDLGYFLLHDNGDTEMWFRIGCHYDIYCIDEILHYHRLWPESFMRMKVDENPDQFNQNLYETRNNIFNYYYKQGKLTLENFNKFKEDNEYLYNAYRIYKSRITGMYGETIRKLWRNFMLNPKQLLMDFLKIRKQTTNG